MNSTKSFNEKVLLNRLRAHDQEADVLDEVIISTTPNNYQEENKIEWNELGYEIQKAIQMLPPKRREVFRRCKEELLSYEDVSAKLGISRNTIKEHMVLAMRFIKEYLKRRSLYIIQAGVIGLFIRG